MVTDQEYLSRSLINGIKYCIDDDKISIQNDCTCFILRQRNKSFITKNEIVRLYKNVIKTAKENGIQISYKSKCKQIISDYYDTYNSEYMEMQKLFDVLIGLSKQVKNRGIHYGHVDDKLLNTLTDNNNKYGKYFWGTSAYSKITDVYFKLNNLAKDINTKEDITKIYI
jgi:hypothetical protein